MFPEFFNVPREINTFLKSALSICLSVTYNYKYEFETNWDCKPWIFKSINKSIVKIERNFTGYFNDCLCLYNILKSNFNTLLYSIVQLVEIYLYCFYLLFVTYLFSLSRNRFSMLFLFCAHAVRAANMGRLWRMVRWRLQNGQCVMNLLVFYIKLLFYFIFFIIFRWTISYKIHYKCWNDCKWAFVRFC